MKLSKSTNALLSLAMIAFVVVFCFGTYVAISLSMRDVYINATKDMIKVAMENVEEHIRMHVSECLFITKTTSFMRYIEFYNDGKENTEEARSEHNQAFNYIYTKVYNTKSINKIMYADETRRVLLSSTPTEAGAYIAKDSYFSEAKTKGVAEVRITQGANGENVFVIAQPVKLYDRIVGTLYMELNFNFIDNLLKNYKYGKNGNFFIMTDDMRFIGANPKDIPQSLTDIGNHTNVTSILSGRNNNQARIYQTKLSTENGSRYMIYSILNSTNAVVASSVSTAEVNSTSFKTAFPMIFLVLVIIGMLVLYRYIISSKIMRPLHLLNRSLYFLKKGDLRARFNFNEDNEFGNLSCVFNQTIASLQATTQNLKRREKRNNILLSNVTDVIWEYDIADDVVNVPDSWSKLLSTDLIGTDQRFGLNTLLEYIHFNDRNDLREMIVKCATHGEDFNADVKIKRSDDSYIWIMITGSCMYNEFNEPDVIIGSIYDITADKLREDSLRDSARRDDMTHLLKKVEIERLIDIDICNTTDAHALMILDLDSFKKINDTYGHLAGDEIIIFTANVLKDVCKNGCYLCRFGGDEFIVYTEMPYTEDEVKVLARDIIARLNAGHQIQDGTHIAVHCSIGIARSPIDGNSYVELIANADRAVYYAKKHDKNQFVFYNDDLG